MITQDKLEEFIWKLQHNYAVTYEFLEDLAGGSRIIKDFLINILTQNEYKHFIFLATLIKSGYDDKGIKIEKKE